MLPFIHGTDRKLPFLFAVNPTGGTMNSRPRRILFVAVLAFLFGIPAKAQFVTLGEKVPPTSGCYQPFTYDQGVNLDIKLWSLYLKASDLRSLGIQPSDIPFEGFPQVDASKLAQILAKDLSRLKDTGTITVNDLPRSVDGKVLIHFYAQINLEPVKLSSGQVTGYVAAAHLTEVCSSWGEGKDVGMGIREIEIPGVLMLSTLDEMLRNLENLIYDQVMEVVKARRQAAAQPPNDGGPSERKVNSK
jgi:hypothetical protein